jgi:hypothetical protein
LTSRKSTYHQGHFLDQNLNKNGDFPICDTECPKQHRNHLSIAMIVVVRGCHITFSFVFMFHNFYVYIFSLFSVFSDPYPTFNPFLESNNAIPGGWSSTSTLGTDRKRYGSVGYCNNCNRRFVPEPPTTVSRLNVVHTTCEVQPVSTKLATPLNRVGYHTLPLQYIHSGSEKDHRESLLTHSDTTYDLLHKSSPSFTSTQPLNELPFNVDILKNQISWEPPHWDPGKATSDYAAKDVSAKPVQSPLDQEITLKGAVHEDSLQAPLSPPIPAPFSPCKESCILPRAADPFDDVREYKGAGPWDLDKVSPETTKVVVPTCNVRTNTHTTSTRKGRLKLTVTTKFRNLNGRVATGLSISNGITKHHSTEFLLYGIHCSTKHSRKSRRALSRKEHLLMTKISNSVRNTQYIDIIADTGAASHCVPGSKYLDRNSQYRQETALQVVGGGKFTYWLRGKLSLSNGEG